MCIETAVTGLDDLNVQQMNFLIRRRFPQVQELQDIVLDSFIVRIVEFAFAVLQIVVSFFVDSLVGCQVCGSVVYLQMF